MKIKVHQIPGFGIIDHLLLYDGWYFKFYEQIQDRFYGTLSGGVYTDSGFNITDAGAYK